MRRLGRRAHGCAAGIAALVGFITLSARANSPPPPDLPGGEECARFASLFVRLMHRDYHEGAPVALTSIGGVAIPSGSRVFLLGSGGEADVYRVVTPTGTSYILRHQNRTPELPLAPYRRNMEFLAEVLTDSDTGLPLEGGGSFRVVSVGRTRGNVLQLGDARGHDLESLVHALGLHSPQAQRLIALFDARVRDLIERTREVVPSARAHRTSGTTDQGAPYRYYEVTTGVRMTSTGDDHLGHAIVWRNVIVDPATLDMTIIDPY